MSLALLQGYSSAEDEDADNQHLSHDDNYYSSGDDGSRNDAVQRSESSRSYKPLLFDPNPPSSSALPSAFDVFSEVSGPPQFLNNSVQEEAGKEDGGQRWKHGGRRNRRDKKDLPSGAVVESKAQLVGIHERVRSDIESNASQAQSSGSAKASTQGGKRVATVAKPNPEDAAELLSMCVRCGVPKTYSHAKGVVCPICGDRPPAETDTEAVKKKGSTMKDKEKSKRMKGQSSHATWKSETEMQLRQQFD